MMSYRRDVQGATEGYSGDIARSVLNYGWEWDDWRVHCGPKGCRRHKGRHKHLTHRIRRIESRAIEKAALPSTARCGCRRGRDEDDLRPNRVD